MEQCPRDSVIISAFCLQKGRSSMKILKKSISILLMLSLLMVLPACSQKEDPNHPPMFQKLSSHLAAPLDAYLAKADLTEDQLAKIDRFHYSTPLTVSFHDIPFNIILLTDNINNVVTGFRYRANFGSDAKEISEALYTLSQAFSEAFGPCQNSLNTAPDSLRFADMTAAELETAIVNDPLNGADPGWHNLDYWSLGVVDTDHAKQYQAVLQTFDAERYSKAPVLLLSLGMFQLTDGSLQIEITYKIDFGWEY